MLVDLNETDADDKPVKVPTGSLPTFHAFRHSFASAWIASGGDLVELSAHLGHANPAITASVYSHEFERAARSDERRARIESMYDGALDPQDAYRPERATVHQIAAKS